MSESTPKPPRLDAVAQNLMAGQSPDEHRARQEAREKYAEILQRLWKQPETCPICGETDWSLLDLVEIPIRDLVPTLRIELQRKGYVFVPVGCVRCGYTMFFHAGVLDQRASELGENS
jgi:predicted nucleic-acid-binding Zn-ribbon protein